MYKTTNDLNIDGFSINSAHFLLERNNKIRDFEQVDFFQIHIVMKKTEITVETRKYNLSAGDLVFIGPSKRFSVGKEYLNKDHVYVVAFSSSFFEKSVNDSTLLNSELFFSPSSYIHITKASIPTEEIQKLIIDRLNLYKEKNNKGFYIATAHNCVEALLLDGLFYVEETHIGDEELKRFTSFDIINRFRILLQKNYKKERTVSFYAEELCVTPRRLTEMAESVFGKSAKQMIIEKIVSESTRMLKYSGSTISEIAYELGFSDEGNFSTFIKKHTLKSPKELRGNS